MSRFALLPALLLASLATPALALPATYTPDPSHTYAYFEVGHLGYSIQRGRFDKLGGKIRLDGASQQGVIDIMIDAASISVRRASPCLAVSALISLTTSRRISVSLASSFSRSRR